VSFHTFTLPEDRCAWFLGKNLGKGMPESVVREELESLDIRVQGVTQLRSGRRDQDPAKDRPLRSHFIVSVARKPEVYKMRFITELCGLGVSVETCVTPKGPMLCKRCQRFEHKQRNCGYAPRCFACGGFHLSGGCSTPREQLHYCGCGGNHTANYRVCVKWKKAKAALAKQAPERIRKGAATGQSAPPKAQQAGSSAEQMDLCEKWNQVVGGGVLSGPTPLHPQTPIQNPFFNRSRRCPGSLK